MTPYCATPSTLVLSALVVCSLSIGCASQSATEPVTVVDEAAEPEPAAVMVDAVAPAADCADGVVYDDGSVETGYGFVPQASSGVYLQQFERSAFDHSRLDKVCVCFLKTKYERDIEYEVVFFEDSGGQPAAEPYAMIPATATGVADSVDSAGAFLEVDVSTVDIVDGTSYIGVRWIPNQAKYLFVCTDTNEQSEATPVFFKEDIKPQWQSVFTSRDPIFRNHRSILLRATSQNDAYTDETP